MADIRTYAQIASNWNLWAEHVDPGANMTEAEFDTMSTQEKIAAMTSMFGVESFRLTCGACSGETMLDLREYQGADDIHVGFALKCPNCQVIGSDWDVESGN